MSVNVGDYDMVAVGDKLYLANRNGILKSPPLADLDSVIAKEMSYPETY